MTGGCASVGARFAQGDGFHRPELLDHARERGYTVVVYSPLAGGRVQEIDAVVDVAGAHETTPE